MDEQNPQPLTPMPPQDPGGQNTGGIDQPSMGTDATPGMDQGTEGMPPEGGIEPKKGFNLKLILIILLILVALGAGAYAYYNYVYLPSQNKPAPTPVYQPPLTETKKTYDTASWDDYSDTKNKFSFKYPKDWNISSTTPAGTNLAYVGIASEDVKDEKSLSEEGLFLNVMVKDSKDKNIDYWLTAKPRSSKNSLVSDKESITVDDISGYIQIEDGTTSTDKPAYSGAVYVIKDKKLYLITLTVKTKKVYDEDKTLLETVVSTFKFSTTSKVETKKWNSYSNTKNKFSIKYPTDWNYKLSEAEDEISFSPTSKKYTLDGKEAGVVKIVTSSTTFDKSKYTNATEITIDQKTAYKTTSSNGKITVYLDLNGKVCSIVNDASLVVANTADKDMVSDYNDIYDAMLTTFEYL